MTTEKAKDIKKILGERCQKIKIDKNLTNEGFTELLGYLDTSSVTKLESGEVNIPLTRLKSISDACKVSMAYLVGETECENISYDMSAKEIKELEKYEEIVSKTVSINHEMEGLVSESYKNKFALDVYNRMISGNKS